VPYESGFAPRWYVRRADIVADALEPVEGQTFCPYKGLASYYNVGEARTAAWSYCDPFEEVERITDLLSFYPEKVTITIDGEKLEPVPGQTVISHGPDRNLSVDEIGGIQLGGTRRVRAADGIEHHDIVRDAVGADGCDGDAGGGSAVSADAATWRVAQSSA
jgi:hypothetical protein